MAEDSSTEKKILVIRTGALGDVANTLRAVCALRTSLPDGARIGWLAEEPSRELVAAGRADLGQPVADEILTFPRKRLTYLLSRPWRWPGAVAEFFGFIRRLRASRYGCVLDFHGNLKSGVLGLLSGAGDRIGFARGHCQEMNWAFNNIWAIPASSRLPRAEKLASLAQVLDPDLELGPVSLQQNAEDAAHVKALLDETFSGDGPLVVLHPGTSAFGRFKRWPAERFGELATALREKVGARCAVTHGPGEDALVEEVVAASNGAGRALPLLSISRLIELLRRADLVVAGDTGPLCIAALLQRPVVGIFGPKDPVIYGPYGTRSQIVTAEVECRPCTRRKCDHVRCIMGIEVGSVLEAAERLLEKAITSG